MKRLFVIPFLLPIILVGNPALSEVSGKFTSYFPAYQKCTSYTRDYAKADTKETSTGFTYPTAAALELGWMMGYITGVNEWNTGKTDFFNMKFSEVAAWVALWCRDNQSGDLWEAQSALYKSRNKLTFVPVE